MSENSPKSNKIFQGNGTLFDSQKKHLKIDQKTGVVKPVINQKKLLEIVNTNTPSNKQNQQADKNSKKCPNFCRESGFSILPLRYGVSSDTKKMLPKSLGENVTNISLTKHKYVTTMITEGYIYLYFKRGSKDEWKGYITNKKGFHSEFQIDEKTPPLVAKDFACESAGHKAKASLIVVPETKPNEIKTVYIIHTHAPLTKAKRLEFAKNADAFVNKGYWQKIDITKWKSGSFAEKHCFSTSQLAHVHHIAENFGLAKWKDITNLFATKPEEYCAISLYDAVGITKTLNDSRNNKAFSGLNKFLSQKSGGFTNEHRMQTLNLVDNMQNTITNNYISVNAKKVIDRNTDISTHSHLDLIKKNALEAAKRTNNTQRVKQLEREIEETNRRREENQRKELDGIGKDGKIKGKEAWEKYEKQLDLNAINNFRKETNNISANGFKIANEYQDDHYNWLISKQLLNNLYYFDKSEDLTLDKLNNKELKESNGYIFHAIVYDFMYGMTFLKKGQELINSWINKKTLDNNNLYLRAYCYNNDKLMTNYNKIFESESSVETELKFSRLIFKAFVAADKAFDSWVEKADTKRFLQNRGFKTSDKFFYWMSIALNSAFKTYSDIGKRTTSIHSIKLSSVEAKKTHIASLLYLKSGDYAQYINRHEIMHQLDFRAEMKAAFPDRTDGKWANYRNTSIVEIENKIKLSIQGKTVAGKNRILAIVAMFEALTFYYQYGAWQEDVKGEPELAVKLAGSFFNLMGASLALIGENIPKTSLAGNLTRLSAGSFATLGSLVGLYMDIKAFKETNEVSISTILFFRNTINLALVVGQIAFLFSSILRLAGGRYALSLSERIALNYIVVFLTASRVVAGGIIINIALLALEEALRAWVLDDAMENWCQKSSFHKATSKETAYKNADEEFKGFAEAIVSV